MAVVTSRRFVAVFFAFVIVAWPCFGQVQKPLGWLRDLTTLQNETTAGMDYREGEVTTIRKEVEEWTALRSGKTADLSPAPEGSWTEEQLNEDGLPLPAAKFATFDLGSIVPIRAGASAQIGVKNLLDRNYYYWEGFPEVGRNWHLTLRYTF